MTEFENKCQILGEVWLDYRNAEGFEDFVSYNDIGLPLAYAMHNGIVNPTPEAEKFVNETFDLFLAALDIEDKGYETLVELFLEQEQKETE